jgi:hypothetical protein
MKTKFLSTLLFLSLILLNSLISSEEIKSKSSLEQELHLKEQNSKIEEIQFIQTEIEQVAKRKAESQVKAEQSKEKQTPKKQMKINSDFTVTGGITANKFYAESAKISGSTEIGHILKASTIQTNKITSQSVVTDKIISNTGVLTIEADLIINNDVMADTVSMRGTSFVLEGVKQWGLVHHDDFESEKSLEGWSDKRTSRCQNGGNTFLGGHCNFSYNEVTKIFKNLPPHDKLKINAAFHMLDSWDGEYAYMKIDDVKVWTKRGQHSPDKGINICGGDFNDPAFNIPIDVSVPHNKPEVKITFGSTLDEEPCNESFGVDDVMIYVR